MGTFTTRKFINGDPSLIPGIASRIESAFTVEGFTVLNQSLLSGSAEVSITKGGLFRAVLGMKTALKISLRQLEIPDLAVIFQLQGEPVQNDPDLFNGHALIIKDIHAKL